MATAVRKVVRIDADKCDGCGLCVPSWPRAHPHRRWRETLTAAGKGDIPVRSITVGLDGRVEK